jgi:hypothetical protein
MRSDPSKHYCCVQKAWRIIFELYEHINYFPIAQIYKLWYLRISYVNCEQALRTT